MLVIKVEAMAGNRIEEVCEEATGLATKLGVTVVFPFNGIQCTAYPGSTAESLELEWRRALDEERNHAFSRTGGS